MSSLLINHGTNIVEIVNRIKTEAETTDQMNVLVNGEVYAYCNLVDTKKPYMINMWDKAIIIGDHVVVGEIYNTEEDFDDDYCGYIIPINYMKGNRFITEYQVEWKLEPEFE